MPFPIGGPTFVTFGTDVQHLRRMSTAQGQNYRNENIPVAFPTVGPLEPSL